MTQPEVSVTVTPNGPYVVRGAPLVRRRIVASADGDPVTWQTTAEVDAAESYALCRCGQSQHKPFCDGSHAREGFLPDDVEGHRYYDEQARSYRSDGLVMRDARGLCAHAAFCTNRVTTAWRMVKERETDDPIARAQVMAMIERCPSGALTYRLADDTPDLEVSLRTQIGVVDDGPLAVAGNVSITDAHGAALEVRNRVTLCRCGASANKPFCDGSHRQIGFRDPPHPAETDLVATDPKGSDDGTA